MVYKGYVGDPSNPVYRVDFRFAYAVLEGKADLRDVEGKAVSGETV